VHLSEGQLLKFRSNFYNATDAQLLHEKGEMKNAVVARDIVILLVSTMVKDLKGIASSETRRREIRYSWRSSENLSPYPSLKFFRGAPKFLARQTPFLHLLRAAKGAIIFHLRYRASYPLARVEKTDVAASSQEWKITGDNKFYEEAPFPAESPFRSAIRFADKIADKNGDCRENSEALFSNEVRMYFTKNLFSCVM